MGSIEKQPNGRYKARYRDPNGRSRRLTFDRLEDARQFLKGVGGDLVHGEFIDPAAARTLFDDWADLWWETTIKLMPSTRRGYRGHLDRHVLPYFKGYKLGAIDYMVVEQFIADRFRAKLSPKMVRGSASVLSLILQCAVKAGAAT